MNNKAVYAERTSIVVAISTVMHVCDGKGSRVEITDEEHRTWTVPGNHFSSIHIRKGNRVKIVLDEAGTPREVTPVW